MPELNIVLLTGPSCSGKTFLQSKLEERGVPCLDNDHEVMKRIFDLLPKEANKRLHEHIGSEAKWRHITQYVDFDRLVRLHHRDWFLRNGSPTAFVGVGWMYSREDHRKQVKGAFQQVSEISSRITIARLIPTDEEFVERYCKRQDEAKVAVWQKVSTDGEPARRRWALNQLERYKTNHWQVPTGKTRVVEIRDVKDVLELLGFSHSG